MFTPFENFLANFSFISLFLSMLLYWIEISNITVNGSLKTFVTKIPLREDKNIEQVNSTANSTSIAITLNSIGSINIPQLGILFANIALFVLLVLRWKESGHFPLSNLYESLMFLSWTLTTIQLILEYNLLLTSNSLKNDLAKMTSSQNLLGSITAPSALFTNAFATFSLPKEMQEASPLVPALQSNWLMMHVTVMILSYGALLCGSLLAIAYLVINGIKPTSATDNRVFLPISPLSPFIPEGDKRVKIPKGDKGEKSIKLENLANTFDNLSYRILGIGFPLLTIGILSGAVWANEAWGSYWSWDPKETWALLTWLVFAIYLHTRLNKGWQGQKPALIASVGFISVWICYLGVNLLGEGLHSYGWFR